MTINKELICFLLSIFIGIIQCQSKTKPNSTTSTTRKIISYTIGFITIDNDDLDLKLNQLSANLSLKRIVLKKLQLEDTNNSIDLTLSLCEMFETNLHTIVSMIKKPVDSQTLLISYLCSYYQIPLISLYNRESVFFDKSIHSSFIRMAPSYFSETKIWVHLLAQLMYKKINFIHSIDDNGQLVSSKFQYLADHFEIEVKFLCFIFFKLNIQINLLRLKK
jgi:hypothetical protein